MSIEMRRSMAATQIRGRRSLTKYVSGINPFHITTKQGYDKVKGEMKGRQCWYEHFEPDLPFIPGKANDMGMSLEDRALE